MNRAFLLEELLAQDQPWVICEEGFNPFREHHVESLLTVGNGYIGARGSIEEENPASLPATMIAGIFESTGESTSVPEMVVVPNWFALRIWVEDEPLELDVGKVLEHRRILDMRRGLLLRDWRHEDRAGRITRVVTMRFASLARRHLLGQRLIVIPENYTGEIHLQLRIDGRVENLENRKYLRPLSAEVLEPAGVLLAMETVRSRQAVAMAQLSRLETQTAGASYRAEVSSEVAAERWSWRAEPARQYRIDKLVSVFSSRDTPRPLDEARRYLEQCAARGFDSLLGEHFAAWDAAWADSDLQIDGDLEAQRALRFAAYHLLISANPEDDRVSIGARTLSGEVYKGHVFWDTEIYMLPFFIYTQPETARTLLMYRYHTLPAAKEKAMQLGYKGALYAWESADTGRETTPETVLTIAGERIPVLSGRYEHHISADIAYAVWQYWQATGDHAFMISAGAEILLETARFWASRVEPGDDGRLHIRRVIGPDEYHELVDDNAFTNYMASWNIKRALDAWDWLAARHPEAARALLDKTGIDRSEMADWAEIANLIYKHHDAETGLIEQFAGYFQLEDIDIAKYEPRPAPLDVLLGRERVQRSQIVKQADVVMLLFLLPEQFDRRTVEANFHYYERRTAHGSSLSEVIYAAVAARLGLVDAALRHFRNAASIDLADRMGNAWGGVHGATLGGLWQSVVLGFAGMKLSGERLDFDPHLPQAWQRLAFKIKLKGRRIAIRLQPALFSLELADQGKAPPLALGSNSSALLERGRYVSLLENGSWLPLTLVGE